MSCLQEAASWNESLAPCYSSKRDDLSLSPYSGYILMQCTDVWQDCLNLSVQHRNKLDNFDSIFSLNVFLHLVNAAKFCHTSFSLDMFELDMLKLLTAKLILSVNQEYFIIVSWFVIFSKYQVESGLLPCRDQSNVSSIIPIAELSVVNQYANSRFSTLQSATEF